MEDLMLRSLIVTILAVLSVELCLLTSPLLGATHTVSPTGDVTQDSNNIQKVIDMASPGDTIVLGAGTFVLGEYSEEDEALVSTNRGAFRYFADVFTWDVRSPEINPLYWQYGGGPDTPPYPKVIVIDKPLIIEGANPPGSTTITTANTWLAYPMSTTLFGDANSFLVASPGVTIRNLRFFNMLYAVRVISAGSVIEDSIFDTCGHYSLVYFMDDYSAYPNFPSHRNPVKSYLRHNTWLNAIQAIHMYGSEIEATDNFFQIRNSDSTEIPISLWAVVLGGLPPDAHFPGVYTNSECRNNLLQNNVVEGDQNSFYGAFYFAGYGVPITKNRIINNVVENMWALMESHGFAASVEGNDIIDNEVSGGELLFSPFSYGVYLEGLRVAPRDNLFGNNRFINVSFPMLVLGGKSNRLIGNDYTAAGASGWGTGNGSVFLAPGTMGNFIREGAFPGATTMCDQVLDLGSNAIPGGGVCQNNPELAPHLQDVHMKQMEHIR
jgi:hypothetical protein